MHYRILETAAREFTRQVAGLVDQTFATLRELPEGIDEIELPWIGGSFDPHRPERGVGFKLLVIKALAARAWVASLEPDMPPLPLSVDDIKAMKKDPDLQLTMFGYYAEHMRRYQWDIRQQFFSFEEFCDQHRRARTRF